MAVSKFERKLKSLLESEVIHESDFVTYTTYLHDLTKMLLEHENDFPIYANVVKSWISGFEKIFSVKKTNNYVGTFWGTYMSKFCLNVTITLFTFLQYFRQFEPDYTQEFYLHWKTIVSRMDGLKRADTFYNLADKFKIVVQHLRTAASRTEQLAIMAVLRIYIECVPVTQLHRLHEHDNAEIIKVVGRFMENPSILHQHEFLHDINAMGHCIESFKPTKIICRKLNIDMDDTNYSMWFDFNKMEQTINFTTVSLADNANQCFGTARRVKLRESVKVSNLLEINGIWNVISVGNIHSAEQRATIRVYFLNKTEELISTAVKSIFRFVSSGGVTGSASQGFISDYTEAEPTEDECKVSPETAPRLNDSFSSVVPPKLISFERTDSKFSLPTPTKSRRDVPRRNTSLPLLPRHESDESDAELPIKSNLTYVIKNSVTSAENGTPPDHSPASDPNATYVLRESVNPIADEQPEYDYDSQTDNGDNVMDNKCPSMELDADNKSLATNRTYTICIGARSGTLVEANPLAEHENAGANSKLLHRHDMVLDEDDAYDGNENAQDDSQYGDPYARSSKKIEIIENITIVPPRVQPQSPEPIENFSGASRQNVEYLHFSQVDVSVNRQVFNQYSQPTTRRERFYVKDTSFRSRNIAHIASNESVQRSSQRPIVVAQVKMENFDNSDGRDDQADQSMRSDRKESFVPFTATTKQNTSSHDDCPLNASNGGTHRSQAVSPWPIEFSGNYESFSPITTSTQRTQVKLRKVSYSQQAYSQLSPDPISSPTEQHSAGSSFQKSFFQNSMTLIGLSQENPEALKANKSLNQTEVMPRASGISETPQTINKKIEFNAGIESPSVQASREKSSENVSQNQTAPKLTKCNSIADLPKMSQLHVGPVTESQRELKPLQNESKATQQFTSKQSSTEKLAQSSLQQSIEAPTVDPLAKLSTTDLNSSVQRTKSLSSQIMSVSAPKREQNSKELRATEVTEASPRHSSQKQAATSSQQLIQSVPIMDPEDDMQSSLKAKRTKFSQSSIQSAPVSRPAQMDLNSSVQPTKSLSSLIMSVSAPKREQNSKELRATEVTEASPQHSSEKQAATSNQQSIQKVPIIDPEDDMESSLKAKRSKLSSIQSAPASRPAQMDLNSSVQPTKSLSSQIMSVSAPKREQNSKELRATEVTEASPRHSSQKQAATSSQQLIQSVPIIYPEDDMESSLKAKRSKLSSIQSAPASQPSQMSAVSQNSTQTPALSLVPQRFENDFTVDLPDDVDCFQPMPNVLQSQAKMSEPQTESTAAKVAPRATISPDNPKASTAIQPKKTAAQKIAKNSAQNKATNATKKLLNPKILREMSAAIVKQPPKGQSKAAPRYSSLTKPTTLNSQRNSENLLTIRFDETDVPDVGNEFAAADNSSNGKTLENDCVNTDGIRVDEEGKVYDDNGCVFANNAEFQRAAKFYIANDGLDFLKKETVTALPASKRQKYERRLKTIQRMIDRGLERLRVGQKKITDIDPYAVTIAETTIQGEKRKRKYKEVSVTTSRKTYVDKAKQVTYTKRTSKMHYVFDEGTSTDSKSTMSKAMSRSKAFSKAKTAQTVKTSYPSSANLAEGKVKSRQNGIISNPSNRPDAKPSSNRLEFDQTPMVSMNEYCAEVNVSPIPASSEIDAGQHKPHKDISAISAGKMSLPIYASQKMVAVHQQKMLTKTICQPPQHHDESPSTNIDCSGDASTNRTAMTGVELCSTTKCAGNMKELLDYLNRIEMESSHTCRGSCERNQNTLKTFIDRLRRKEFHQDRGVSDWEQLFNCLLESLESMCNTASDRLQVHEGESNGQAI
ncbi:uncharacterized protein LOC119079013 isoform X6 [Bradysia coprophila]|uniref:uncharacterized protein LOC119079013 isoform X6 n=1 Tax=Bradysia coprophila TaxID=38358 RepID=UPI00187D6EB4|nr:uncharacterized protein LOC119079013 isoform X6 [Bradysia coprophila]